MLNANEAQQVIGKTVYSGEGEKVGKVGQVFLDDESGSPEFLTVNTGLFGTSESFVPVDGASLDGDDVTVPFGKDKIKSAPRVDLDNGHLDESDEQRLYEYYGRAYGEQNGAPTGSGDTDQVGTDDPAAIGGDREGHDTSGPTTDSAMTRSEEHLEVGTTTQAAGRARLRKYVTTEDQTVTVPVRKERAVLETEPVDGSNLDNATEGPVISEEEHEVILSEERVVVDKVAEPVERVRLGTETVTDQETVSDEVRKE
ncbi:MAG: PRC and DUF2382 domain-containing protein, partial [Marmoricola sp.]